MVVVDKALGVESNAELNYDHIDYQSVEHLVFASLDFKMLDLLFECFSEGILLWKISLSCREPF